MAINYGETLKLKTCILVLAYNVENEIEDVLKNLITLNIPIYIIDDFSKDNTKNIIKSFIKLKSKKLNLIENKKNIGAGNSLKKLMALAKSHEYEYFVKVDGDNQFLIKDIRNLLNILDKEEFDFVKSNRFWRQGISGKIPFHRLVGNLIATVLLQFSTGTNLLYDPLNGLFGGKLTIVNFLDSKLYPKRYGYPFYFVTICALNDLKIYQYKNTVRYANEKSNLKIIRVLFTLIKITIFTYIKKIKIKINIDNLQFSAFLDLIFLTTSLVYFYCLFKTFIYFFIDENDGNQGQWFILAILFFILSLYTFIKSFLIESKYKNNFIYN